MDKGEPISEDSINISDLVFRVMTWDHVPLAPKPIRVSEKKKSAKDMFVFNADEDRETFDDIEDVSTLGDVSDKIHAKVNFPPFQHFKHDDATNTFRCVGKSHWVGGIENGHFSIDHGNITNKLAKMYIMLSEKYAMKYNWRGYSYRDEMQNSAILQLTYAGLRFNESRSSNPFAFFTTTMANAFVRVLNVEKKSQNIRDDILEINNLTPSMSRQMKDYNNPKRDHKW